MSKINPGLNRDQVAAIVVDKLKQHGISAVLVGGSVVSIYTENKYESFDLDFISPANHKRISSAMNELGFKQQGKDFFHEATKFTVEFPSGPIAIGDQVPIIPEGRITVDGVDIVLLSPTQSVMDRLACFFYHNDRQCLDQAVWIANKQPVNIEKIKEWALNERQETKLKIFLDRL